MSVARWAMSGSLFYALALTAAGVDAKTVSPTPADLHGPWNAADAAIVLDPYHANTYSIADLKLDPKIVAVIHKASEGATITDPSYGPRKQQALAAGYLWGSYHVGRPGHAVAQADRYLDLVKPAASEAIALDLEQDGGAMSMTEAVAFITRVRERTGRYPLLYGGRNTMSRPVTPAERDVLRNCPLWIVSTRDMPSGWPKDIWPNYTLWQFSSELRYRYHLRSASAQHPVSQDTDVNFFPGGREALSHTWPFKAP